MSTQTKCGGARPGAGRKPSGRRQFCIWLDPGAHAWMLSQAASKKMTLGEYLYILALASQRRRKPTTPNPRPK
jgi:hypothetical protein